MTNDMPQLGRRVVRQIGGRPQPSAGRFDPGPVDFDFRRAARFRFLYGQTDISKRLANVVELHDGTLSIKINGVHGDGTRPSLPCFQLTEPGTRRMRLEFRTTGSKPKAMCSLPTKVSASLGSIA